MSSREYAGPFLTGQKEGRGFAVHAYAQRHMHT
jgi:hypothetical protein